MIEGVQGSQKFRLDRRIGVVSERVWSDTGEAARPPGRSVEILRVWSVALSWGNATATKKKLSTVASLAAMVRLT